MNNLLWCLMIFVAATAAQTTNTNPPINHGLLIFWLIKPFWDRQRGPWDVAFDQTFGFVFTNFSKHQFKWTADKFTFDGNISGIETISRTCPIIIYQTKESPESAMHYFVRACAKVAKLGLVGKVNGTSEGQNYVSILLLNNRALSSCSERDVTCHEILGFNQNAIVQPSVKVGSMPTTGRISGQIVGSGPCYLGVNSIPLALLASWRAPWRPQNCPKHCSIRGVKFSLAYSLKNKEMTHQYPLLSGTRQSSTW